MQLPDEAVTYDYQGLLCAAAEDWTPFAALYAAMDKASPWPAEVERVRGWYQPHLERVHDDAAVRAADLVQLQRIAETYPSRERFLTDLTLDPPDATSDEAGPPLLDEDYLILSTIHSAKGQEWNAVFLLNGVDGCIPSDMGTGTSDEIEEERRLLYVAMTRARDRLAIMIPQRFYVHQQRGGGDRHLYAARTRFIPNALLPLFAQVTWFPAGAPRPRTVEDIPRIDIGARMRGMWR
jgi:DNA helicase-2/ATP-dependent DNA helicase PcrA